MTRPEWMPKNPYDESVEQTLKLYKSRGERAWYGFAEAIAQKAFNEGRVAQLQKLIAWGEEDCAGHVTPSGKPRKSRQIPRRMCLLCWEQVKRETAEEGDDENG